MAETLVLAKLSIDSNGVVTGISLADKAMQKGETALKKFDHSQKAIASTTGIVTMRFLDFRRALISVATSLGIVGIIATLVIALKGLVTELISSSTWFKKAKEAVTDWWRELVHGEDAAGRLSRKVREITSGVKIETVFDIEEQIKVLEKKRRAIEDLIRDFQKPQQFGEPVSRSLITNPLEYVTKLRTITTEARGEIDKLRVVIVQINNEMDKLKGKTSFADFIKAAGLRDPIAQLEELHRTLARVNAEAAKSLLPFLLKQIAERAAELKKQGVILPPELAELITEPLGRSPADILGKLSAEEQFTLNQIEDVMSMDTPQWLLDIRSREWIESLERAKGQLWAIGKEIEMTRMRSGTLFDPETIEEITGEIKKATVKMQIMTMAAQQLGGAIARSFARGGKGIREELGKALKDLAIFFLTQSIAALAMGLMASTTWGQMLGMGNPAGYYAAAKMYAVAAAMCGAGAAALGGGREHRNAGGGGGARGHSSGGGGGIRQQHIEVHVHGDVEDPDRMAREIARLLRTAEADGAAD